VVLFTSATVYPNLSNLVTVDLAVVHADQRKFKAFKTATGLNTRRALAAISMSTNPRLLVRDLDAKTSGLYEGGNEIFVNRTLADQYERIFQLWGQSASEGSARTGEEPRWQALVTRAARLMESIILHELVHWGDRDHDGLLKDIEAQSLGWADVGHWFVHQAYGNEIKFRKATVRGRNIWSQVANHIPNWLGWDKHGTPYAPGEPDGPSAPPPP